MGFSGFPQPFRLRAMTTALAHRGPDGEGIYEDPQGHMNLGHRRLSIIDLDTGDQPMGNERGDVQVVFNGEIYNYKELRDWIAATGRHRMATRSDTETLLHLYEEDGPDFVSRLNGMFAFALWDGTNRRLLLARDRLGVKPLYWTEVDGKLLFSSELAPLLLWPGVDRGIDPEALSLYLSLRYVPEPKTMYRGVFALPPGHRLLWRPGAAPSLERYWFLDFSQAEPATREEVLCDELDALLRDAVRLRLRSDVPMGVLLSGGVDSSLAVALIRQFSGEPLHSFSLGYADRLEDKRDVYYARMIADRYGTDHHEHAMAASELAERIPTLARHFGQPFAGVVSTYFLTRLVRDHVKVVLSGDGADELFASYGHHRLVWPLANLAAARDNGAADPYAVADLAPLGDRVELVRRFDGMPPWQVRAGFGAFSAGQKRGLLATDAGRAIAGYDAGAFLEPLFRHSTARDGLNRMLDVDIRTSLPGEVLLFSDRLSMAHGVEVRSPFLDYRVAELAARVPGTLKIRGGTLKYLLKTLAARYLPREILDRPKEGFVQPNHVWLRGQLDAVLDDLLSPDSLAEDGLFDPASVRSLIDDHRQGRNDHAFRIWTLVMFQAWQRDRRELSRMAAANARTFNTAGS
ncbi:asparagine synthase (glutamine-hydrolyzing) [Roseomonas genomospecies 6]|uniref:asparagine synthase (glutamine-hydrolyzing) n=1 Tax=Roseomonas genomospecies 6 TaxID=214106 RepID=UPI00142F1D2B|nr:asparagine synthase (glutamine-hydrolyzing) [Roseomonas genomospecies 6]